MLCKINAEENNDKWLEAYWSDFRRRFLSLLSYSFNTYTPSLSLSILINKTISLKSVSKYIILLLYYYVISNLTSNYIIISNTITVDVDF